MADVLDDVLDALNYARHATADLFSEGRAGTMDIYRRNAQAMVDGAMKEYGDASALVYGAAFLASAGDVLLNFATGVAEATFFDPLRIGDGVKTGTFGGYAEDALRVVGIAGGAMKLLRFGNFIRNARSVQGGMLSCTSTSAAKAFANGRLVNIPTVETLAAATKDGADVLKPTYGGALLADVVPTMNMAGMSTVQKVVRNAKDIVQLVDRNEGPVLFSAKFTNGSAHTMMAYRPLFGSGVRLADQYGNFHALEIAGSVEKVVLGPGTSTAGLLGGAAVTLKQGMAFQIANVYQSAYIARDAVLLDVAGFMPLVKRIGVPIFEVIDNTFWPRLAYQASKSGKASGRLKKAGSRADELARLLSSNEQMPTADLPNGGGMKFSRDASKLLDLIGPPKSRTDWTTLSSRARAAGINDPRRALGELEGFGAIDVVRIGDAAIQSVERH